MLDPTILWLWEVVDQVWWRQEDQVWWRQERHPQASGSHYKGRGSGEVRGSGRGFDTDGCRLSIFKMCVRSIFSVACYGAVISMGSTSVKAIVVWS
jgi:hypothetical protein